MILAKKVRLHPTPKQEQQLWKSVGTARWAYNWALDKQVETYKNGGKFISDQDLRKELTMLKQTEGYAWLYEVSNNVTKQAIKDACEAFKKFFQKKSSFPKFKSKKNAKPAFYNDTEKLKINKDLVLIEKVGWMPCSEPLPMNTKYTNPRVSFDGKYWYIAVGMEQETEQMELTGESIGVDLGLKQLATVSNMEKPIKNINKSKEVKRLKKKLRRKQRQVSRKYEQSKQETANEKGGNRYKFTKTKNIAKMEKEMKLIHRKLRNIRSNHIHQATAEIVKTKPSRIVVEDLNVRGMMKNQHLAKAIAEQGFHQFISILIYKCQRYGIELLKANRFYPSSKTCSVCAAVKKDLKLSDRVFICASCNCRIDRDLNAAINLSRYQQSA